MKNSNIKVLIIGPYPPPEGGVSVHLKRLLKKSSEYSSPELAIFDPGRRIFVSNNIISYNIITVIKYFLAANIVHIHSSHRYKLLIGRITKLFGKKLLFTIHNPRELENVATKNLLKISDKTIYVFRDENYPERLVIPAYIPSIVKADNIPFVKLERKLIVAMGSTPKSQSDNEDIYGFNILIEAIPYFKSELNCLIVFVDVNGTFESRYRSKIEALNKPDSNSEFLYLSTGIDFPAILKQTDVYVRPTTSDGDSIAVREALDAGAIVVASDCVIRPTGCLLFQTNDVIDLGTKISEAFGMERKVYKQVDFSGTIFNIYAGL